MLRVRRNVLARAGRQFTYAETGVSLYWVFKPKSTMTVDEFCSDVPGHVRPVFRDEYHGALVGTDLTRPEYASFRMNPAYRQWEEEKMDIYSGPDALPKPSERTFFQRNFFLVWFLSFSAFVVFWDRIQLIPWLHPPGYTPLRATDMFYSLIEGPSYVFGWVWRSITNTQTEEDLRNAEMRRNRVVDPLMQYQSITQKNEIAHQKKMQEENEYRRQKVRDAARAYQERKRAEREAQEN